MKYSQLVHMSRDVKHWLEQQLEAHGIDGVLYTKYLIHLFQEDNFNSFPNYLPPGLDSRKKYDIETLLLTLCTRLKEIENTGSSDFEISADQSNNFTMDPNLGFSCKRNNNVNCIEPIQPCLPPNTTWPRGLLHDSPSEIKRDKMDDYFSTLFYDDPADVLGFEFIWNDSERKPNETETDRINFYNKQNLLASECSERLYERNADIDKLVAKFDANIEDIWKPTSKSDPLTNMKYHTIFSQNFFSSSYLQYGSNMIWSFEQNESEGQGSGNHEAGNVENPMYKSSFSHWNKFSSPVLANANNFDTMLSAFNVTLSNIQKWSSMDGQNYKKNGNCFMEVISKGAENLDQSNGLSYISEDSQNYQEEEDLLTSAKTHFRPIRAEELAGSQTGIYADGTTFAISNDLEKVSFKRSESGALYLEADANTPRKYMEFKEKEGISNKGDCESEVSSIEEFVPKFRVRQSNEKCCQTDDIDDEQMVPSVNETDCDSVSSESEDEFYFPGDEELAQNITNAIDDVTGIEKVSDCNYNNICESHENKMETLELSLYKMPEPKQCFCNSGKDWNLKEDMTKKQKWSQIWNEKTSCDNCKANSDKLSTKDKFLFREELTQEGEQLLSDLSCLQQKYSSTDWYYDDSVTASELNEEEAQNSIEEVGTEGFPFNEVVGNFEKGAWWSLLIAKDEPVKGSFDMSSLWSEEKFSSNTMENDKNQLNEIHERPFDADAIQAERKRRNSSSQKPCELFMKGQCRRPLCRIAHCDSAIPYPFFADASSRMKGESCSLSHGVRRPLSL